MLKIKLFQITGESHLMFLGLDAMKKIAGVEEVDPSIYEKVYEGTVETEELEGVFRIFNGEYPADYTGRSMSVSDVVCITDGEKAGYYFCDSIGFEKIKFDESAIKQSEKEKTLRVVVCRPGQEAEVADIEHTLHNLQKIVSEGVDDIGLIEPFYPFEDAIAIICNEEGKFNGLVPCRAVYDNGELLDVVFGTFIICGVSKSEFISLTDEQVQKYLEMFKAPECIMNMNGRIIVIKM